MKKKLSFLERYWDTLLFVVMVVCGILAYNSNGFWRLGFGGLTLLFFYILIAVKVLSGLGRMDKKSKENEPAAMIH
jgi:energy-coupling factor transporter transmembrane protein EcfT